MRAIRPTVLSYVFFVFSACVFTVVILNTLSRLFLWSFLCHLGLMVVCNMFVKIRLCYNVLEYMPGVHVLEQLEDYTIHTIGEEGEGRDLTNQGKRERDLSDIDVSNKLVFEFRERCQCYCTAFKYFLSRL